MEILAPAGAWPQLEAAVRSGADAVYLGTQALNARMKAGNFDDLGAAVSYCHVRNVKVYVTVNTLIRECEIPLLLDTLSLVASSGADALLVTDMGAVRLAKKACPDMKLHGSTQMTVHNLSGALLLRDMGFSRVVLAREMSRDEIACVTARSGIETEVFVHGALCMSVSGQCLLSSFWGQRSGNRGRCAQPCRLNFHTDSREYALSLKDLSLCEYMKELEDMGVASAKIEGRLKRPEYVAAAVKACSSYREDRHPDMKQLAEVFSRNGFTQGFYLNKRDFSMFGRRTEDDENSRSLSVIRDYYRNERQSVPVSFILSRSIDGATCMELTDDIRTLVREIPPENGLKSPLPAEAAKRALGKLGGTPYIAKSIIAGSAEGYLCRTSDITKAKSDLLQSLTESRARITPVPYRVPDAEETAPVTPPAEISYYLFFSDIAQWNEEFERENVTSFLPAEQMDEAFVRAYPRIGARLFPFAFGEEDRKARNHLTRLQEAGLKWVSVGNPGGIYLARTLGLKCFGEYSLGILNTAAAAQYGELGIDTYDLSVECGLDDRGKDYLPGAGMLIYGRIPLMSYRVCPLRDGHCDRCAGKGVIKDRYGLPFRIMCHQRSVTQMINPHPLYWGDKKSNLLPLHHYSLLFTVESPKECREAFRACCEGASLEGEFTRGLYNKQLL